MTHFQVTMSYHSVIILVNDRYCPQDYEERLL